MGITKTIAKNTVFSAIATATDSVAMVVVGIVLARYLGAEKYGLYTVLMQFLSLALFAVNLGMGEMVKRFIAEAIGQRNENAVKGFVRMTLTFRTMAGVLASVVILAGAGFLARLYDQPSDTILFVFIASGFLPYVLMPTILGIFAGFQKYEYGTYITLVVSPARAIGGIILAVLGFGIMHILILYIGLWVVGVVMGLFLLNRLTPLRGLTAPKLLDKATRNSAMKYSAAALGMLGVDYFLWQQPEIVLLGIYRQVQEVGFYTIAQKIPTLVVNIIPFVFGGTLLPAISEQFGRGRMDKIREIYHNSSRYLMMMSFPLAAGGIALARPLTELFFGHEYAPSIIMMQLVFVPFALWGLTHAVSSVIYGIRQPTLLLKIGGVLIALDIGLCFWLIPMYGAIGAIAATSVPRILSLPVYIYFVSKKIGEKWPMKDTVKILAASIIMGLATFVLQRYTGILVGVAIGIPMGVILYTFLLIAFGSIAPQDIKFLRKLEDRLPAAFRRFYAGVLSLLTVFIRQKQVPSDSDVH